MPSQTFFNLPDTKRKAIIDASMNLFIEHQYEGVTIRALAAKSGISIGSFYQYFEDKDDIYLYLIIRIAKKVFRQYRDAYGTTFMKNKNLPLGELLTEQELAMDGTWHYAPVGVMIKFYFGNFSRNLSMDIYHDLQKLEEEGKLKDCVDIDLIYYQYVTAMFNMAMYFREKQIDDEEERLRIKNNYYNEIFPRGILK